MIGEVKFQTDWYNYETKYNEGQSKTIIPADLNTKVSNKINGKNIIIPESEGNVVKDIIINSELID